MLRNKYWVLISVYAFPVKCMIFFDILSTLLLYMFTTDILPCFQLEYARQNNDNKNIYLDNIYVQVTCRNQILSTSARLSLCQRILIVLVFSVEIKKIRNEGIYLFAMYL